jgi:predicted membrane-bound spermidine synthase
MRLACASAAFFVSGLAALAYQIVWQRLLVLPMGADVYSTTIIVGAFMAGLGCGSLAGGRAADRLTARQCVWLFVGAELAVGAFGFASRTVFYDWLYLRLGEASLHVALTAAIVFASLLWPTFWMGVSLPALARAVTERVNAAATRVGLLYGLNTLGAATGAFVTTWVLFPRIGLAGAIKAAALLNLIAAIAALPLVRAAARVPAVASAEAGGARREARGAACGAGESGSTRSTWPLAAWIALYAVAGFQALSLEIVWFRLLGVMAKSSAFTFATLLTIYLSGLGLGAALGSALVGRVRQPGRAFLLLQAFVGLYAGGSVLALVRLLPSSAALAPYWSYFAGYEPLDAAAAFAALSSGASDPGAADMRAAFVRLYVLLPVALVGPPTLAMGACFPLLQKIALVDLGRLGRRVAAVLVANIAGSAAGAILTGWLALTWLGSAGSLRLMAAIGAVFLGLAAIVPARDEDAALERGSARRRGPVAIAAIAIAAALVLAMPDGRRLWAAVHGTTPPRIVTAEDATGLALVKQDATTGARAVVYVNGIGQSWIPFGGIHTVLGALPAFIHPDPRSAVVIGLGSGDTVYAVAGRAELSRIVCVEIIEPQLATLAAWGARSGDAALASLLNDPRIAHVAGDGRAYVMRSPAAFDIIEADALRPGSAYSGNLYSVGYFTLLRSRLAAGGLAVTWAPTPRIHDTFTSVFPHALSFGDILVGSGSPIPFDPAEVRSRLQAPGVREHFFRAGVDLEALLAPYLANPPRRIESSSTPRPADLNEDLFPRDEFSVPRRR